jgi:hypothetical protein
MPPNGGPNGGTGIWDQMSLAALIIADEEGFAGGAPSGDLTLFAMPLVEMQARLAFAAGATHIIINAGQVPATLVTALDRLKADGIETAMTRTPREAADSIHPEERVILMAAHSLPSRSLLSALVTTPGSAIVVAPLKAMTPSRELIDAEHDWAGLALIDGKLIRHTASMLGEWALGSTVLRLAVQANAQRLKVDPEQGLVVDTVVCAEDCRRAEDSLVQRHDRSISGQAVGWLALAFIRTPVPLPIMSVLPLAMLCAALFSTWAILPKTGLALYAGGSLIARGIRRLADASMIKVPALSLFWKMNIWAGRAIFVLLGVAGMQLGMGWGAVILALWLVWSLWEGTAISKPWKASELGSALILLLFAFADQPVWGLATALAAAIIPPLLEKLRPALTKAR